MKFTNPTREEIAERLRAVRTVAVLGLSPKPHRASYEVAAALQSAGFRIVPVRPGGGTILGEPVAADLDAAGPVDLVDVFRASEHVAGIVDDVIRLGLPAVWFQDGVVDEAAAERARAAGVFVVMDRCLARDGLPSVRSTAGKDGNLR